MRKAQNTRKQFSSADQLTQDFGTFPPVPLQATDALSRISVNVVLIRRLQKIVLPLKTSYAIYSAFRSDDWTGIDIQSAAAIKPTLIAARTNFENVKAELKDQAKGTINGSSLDKVKSTIALLANLILIGLFLPFALVYLGFSIIKTSRRVANSLLGFYIGIGNLQNNLYINPKTLIASQKYTKEGVISHEHIHMLQRIRSDIIGQTDTGLIGPIVKDNVLSEKYRKNPLVLYFIDRRETEARLHELVLSYYRAKKALPLTYSGFISLFFTFQLIANVVRTRHPSVYESLEINDIEYVSPRNEQPMEELAFLLTTLKDEQTVLEYITEVLPVMYANLFHYYGDTGTSKRFLDTVPSTRMFSELYVTPRKTE